MDPLFTVTVPPHTAPPHTAPSHTVPSHTVPPHTVPAVGRTLTRQVSQGPAELSGSVQRK